MNAVTAIWLCGVVTGFGTGVGLSFFYFMVVELREEWTETSGEIEP